MLNILSYISLFLLLFDLHIPPLRGIGSAPFSIVISTIGFMCQSNNYIKILLQYKNIIILYYILFVYVLIRTAINFPEFDTSYLMTAGRSTLIFIATLFYLCSFSQEKLFSKILNLFFFSSIIAIFIGTFQEYQIIADFVKSTKTDLIGWNPYRNSFIAGSGYFGIGAPFGLATSFFFIYKYIYEKINIIFILKWLVIFIAGILAARTVFISMGITIIFLIVSMFSKLNFKVLLTLFLLGCISFYVLNLEIFEIYQTWLFEIFYKESTSGNDLLYEHTKIPTSLCTWTLGDGLYALTSGEYYMRTDIGYLRHLYFGGLFFTILVVSILFFLYRNNRNYIFLFLIIPICLAFHFKGVFIYNSPIGAPLLILMSQILYNKKQRIT